MPKGSIETIYMSQDLPANQPLPQTIATVLHVDDDPLISELIKYRLERQNCRVLVAKSGKEALELFKKFPVDIAVLDVSMPRMDGFELLKELRRLNPVLPVIMLTGLKDDKNLFMSLKHGCNSLLEKPVPIDLLISHIHRLIKSLPRTSQAA